MTNDIRGVSELGDADLVLRARSGDGAAFGELWRRHYRSGIAVAHSVTSSIDADDLVQEAYTRIYQSIQRGGGPTGSFRAYLFTSIRNTAAGWGRARKETAIDVLDLVEDPSTSEEATNEALDRSLTHQAFRSLPTRWQEVLWYSEIEAMKPSEIAPLLGMKATAVAQLTFRAREGLREAWIQAHLRSVEDGSTCQWTISRLGAFARGNLGKRDQGKVDAHLSDCARCAIVAAEAREVGGRLALVLLPLAIGATGTAGYLATLQNGGVGVLSLAAMPSSVIEGAVSAVPVAAAAAAPVVPFDPASAASAASTLGASGAGAAGAAATGGAMTGIGAFAGLAAAGLVLVGAVVTATIVLPDLMASPAQNDSAAVRIADDPPAEDSPAPSVLPLSTSAPEPVPTAEPAPVADSEPATPSPLPAPPVPAPPVSAPPAAPAPTPSTPAPSPPSPAPEPAPEPEPEPEPRPEDVLPEGAPVAGAASASFAGSTLTVVVPVTGAPGSQVVAVFGGIALPTVTLDADGAGTIAVQPTLLDLVFDTTLALRYSSGVLSGPDADYALGDVVTLDTLIAAWEAANTPTDPPAGPQPPVEQPVEQEPAPDQPIDPPGAEQPPAEPQPAAPPTDEQAPAEAPAGEEPAE